MILKVSGASKSFGKKDVFHDVNLWAETGEIVGLFGRNGSGKSTLLKMMFGVLEADSLRLQIDDINYRPNEIIPNRLIAYLPQDRFLPPGLTVRNLVPMYYKAPEILDKIFYAPGVADFEQTQCGKLSGGQRKYLEILLIAYLSHPFLLLDEPFSMIDPKYKDLIKELLLNLKEDKGILLTDHYFQDVLQVSGRNYLLNNGQILEVKGEKELRKYGYLSSLMDEIKTVRE